MIKLNNLNKYYFRHKSNEIHVLDNVSLEFDDVGFTTILGPSGSGKSTLLHVIGGLDKASGSISYDDENFESLCGHKMDLYRNEKVGYIFQNYHLLPDLTVYQNLKVQLDLIGVKDKEEVDKRIDLCLKVVGMDKYKRRNVTALSGGQQQRVAIARALVKGAKVIIADEPTGNLDSKNSIEVMNILKSLSDKCLIILVTHEQSLAVHYSDRIIKIKDGHIISDEVNNNDNTYLTSNKGKIYLDQLEKEVIVDNNHNITLFSNEKQDINLKIVIVNNEIYIEEVSGRSVKVIGQNTDTVLIDKSIQEESENIKVQENFMFDKPKKLSFKDKLLNILEVFKSSFLSFVFAKKRTQIVHSCFIFIGILLCFCLASLKYCTSIDDAILKDYIGEAVRVNAKKAPINSKYSFTFEYDEVKEIIEGGYGAIGLVDPLTEATIRYRYMANRKIAYVKKTFASGDEKCYAVTPYLLNSEIKLSGKEVALSSVLAQELVDYLNPFGVESYEDLYNGEFDGFFTGVYSGDFVIKEVFDYPSRAIMFSEELYLSLYTTTAAQGFSYRYLNEGEVLPGLELRELEQEKPYLRPVYMSKNLENYVKESDLFIVHGYFDSEDFEVVFLTEKDYDSFVYSMVNRAGMNVMPYDNLTTELVEGTLPVNNNEVIIPDVLKNMYPIGSIYTVSGSKGISYSYVVTGYFDTLYPTNSMYIYSNSQTAYLRSLIEPYDKASYDLYQTLDFFTNDPDKLISAFEEMGYEASVVKDIVIKETSTLKIDESKLTIIISITIFIVMVIFIFFISRSKMLSSIYNIGVYRALGSMKKRIYTKYFVDSLVLTTFTVVLGYMVMYAFVCYADNYLVGLNISGLELLISIGSIYILMIFASLLPVVLLLKKTPIEIIGKYDI